jgi:fluoride exporter
VSQVTFSVQPFSTRATLYVWVGLGSALGAMARWGISVALQAPDTFPWGTLSVNVLGSLLIGFYAARVAPGRVWHHHGPGLRLFVMTGFCGGFTTFSMFGLETLVLVETGHLGLAATYVIGSLVLWMAGVWAGWKLGTQARWGAAR